MATKPTRPERVPDATPTTTATPTPAPTATPAPTLRAIFAGRRGAFLLTVLLAEFGAAMQGIAYSTILPVIADDLDGHALFGATLASGSVAAVLMLTFAPLVLRALRPSALLLLATTLYVLGAALAVFAPSMLFVLIGTIVRGVASGLFAGFGLGAIGTLYSADERPCVFGVFSLVWLLPSVIGPAMNAFITEITSWHWAIAWPAIIILAARIAMAFTLTAIPPAETADTRLRHTTAGVIVAAALAVGSLASALHGIAAQIILAGALATGLIAMVIFLARARGALGRILLAFAAVCAAYFGLHEMLSLVVIEALGQNILWAAGAVTVSLVGWSIVGLRPRPHARPDRAVIGTMLVAIAVVVALVAVLTPQIGTWLLIVGAFVAGAGMGAAYPLLAAEPFDTDAATTDVGALVAFAETAATAWVALYTGGFYSAMRTSGMHPALSVIVALALLAALSVVAVVFVTVRKRPSAQPLE